MDKDEARLRYSLYMREYRRKNAERINAQRRERAKDPAIKAKRAAQDKAYYDRTVNLRQTDEARAKAAEAAAEWRKNNPDKAKESKRRYYSSAVGRRQKAKEDAAYIASGGRAKAERRRATKPVSPARKAARVRWAKNNPEYMAAKQAERRAKDKKLNAFERWVLLEAASLARVRTAQFGFAWEVDHILPVSKGGTSEPKNLQVVPAVWNRRKSNKSTALFFARA